MTWHDASTKPPVGERVLVHTPELYEVYHVGVWRAGCWWASCHKRYPVELPESLVLAWALIGPVDLYRATWPALTEAQREQARAICEQHKPEECVYFLRKGKVKSCMPCPA